MLSSMKKNVGKCSSNQFLKQQMLNRQEQFLHCTTVVSGCSDSEQAIEDDADEGGDGGGKGNVVFVELINSVVLIRMISVTNDVHVFVDAMQQREVDRRTGQLSR